MQKSQVCNEFRIVYNVLVSVPPVRDITIAFYCHP